MPSIELGLAPASNVADYAPRYETTAMSVQMSSRDLEALGFRPRYVIQLRVASLTYPDCRAFDGRLLRTWWCLMGQDWDNVESARANYTPYSQGNPYNSLICQKQPY